MLRNADRAHPFYIRRGKVGALLVHGFTGSPGEFRELGELLAAADLTVSCPLLPGHGTNVLELNRLSWRAWVDAVDAAYVELTRHCERVFAIGLSFGGVLALHLAAHRPVAGVATFAAFLRPSDWRAPLTRYFRYFKATDMKRDVDIKDPIARKELCAYDRHALGGVSEMCSFLNHMVDDLPDVRCPVLLMHSRIDPVVGFSQMAELANRLGSADVRQVAVENSYHVLTVDYDKALLNTEVKEFIARH